VDPRSAAAELELEAEAGRRGEAAGGEESQQVALGPSTAPTRWRCWSWSVDWLTIPKKPIVSAETSRRSVSSARSSRRLEIEIMRRLTRF
jgi:hypothetical protein